MQPLLSGLADWEQAGYPLEGQWVKQKVREGDPDMTEVREDFADHASEEMIQQVAERMRERNIEVVVVDDGDEARKVVLERVPEGAEVHSGKSKTLQDAGIFDAIHDASRYDALRPRLFKMDRKNQAREIRKLIAGPDFMLGSVNAVTEEASCSWPA